MSEGIKNRIGQFHYADGGLRRRTVDGVDYLIGIAGAYNAFGLIGPEHNGLFILDDTNKQVVLDRDTEQQSGYFGPGQKQWDRLKEVMQLPAKDFDFLIHNHPRSRLPQKDYA